MKKTRFRLAARSAGWLLGALLALGPVAPAGTIEDRGGLSAPDEGGETVPSVSIDPGFEIVGSFAEIRGLLIGLEGGQVLVDPVDPQRPRGHLRATFLGDAVLHLDRGALERSRLKVRFLAGTGGATQVAAPGYGSHAFVSSPGQELPLPMRRLFGPQYGLDALHIDIVDAFQQHRSFRIQATGDVLTLSLHTIQ